MSRAVVDRGVLQFLAPVMEFTIHNATDEPVTITYDGETRVIPPSNKVVAPHEKFEDVCHSAKDSEGNWIPGTLVIKDIYDERFGSNSGVITKNSFWRAADAIMHALQIDVGSGEAMGPFAKRGLSVLPKDPSPALVEKVRAAGRARFQEWIIDQAQATVQVYNDRNASLRAAGHSQIPLGRDYERASAILELSRGKERSRAEEILSPEASYLPTAPETEEEALEDYLAQKIQELAEKVDTPRDLTAEELVAKIKGDKKAMELFKAEFKVRKLRGKKPSAEATQ